MTSETASSSSTVVSASSFKLALLSETIVSSSSFNVLYRSVNILLCQERRCARDGPVSRSGSSPFVRVSGRYGAWRVMMSTRRRIVRIVYCTLHPPPIKSSVIRDAGAGLRKADQLVLQRTSTMAPGVDADGDG